jgi:hypothetical protein
VLHSLTQMHPRLAAALFLAGHGKCLVFIVEIAYQHKVQLAFKPLLIQISFVALGSAR